MPLPQLPHRSCFPTSYHRPIPRQISQSQAPPRDPQPSAVLSAPPMDRSTHSISTWRAASPDNYLPPPPFPNQEPPPAQYHSTLPFIAITRQGEKFTVYHVCNKCCRPRSIRFHREHPIDAGSVSSSSRICHRCQAAVDKPVKDTIDGREMTYTLRPQGVQLLPTTTANILPQHESLHVTHEKVRTLAREEVERYRHAERLVEAHPEAYAHGRLVEIVPEQSAVTRIAQTRVYKNPPQFSSPMQDIPHTPPSTTFQQWQTSTKQPDRGRPPAQAHQSSPRQPLRSILRSRSPSPWERSRSQPRSRSNEPPSPGKSVTFSRTVNITTLSPAASSTNSLEPSLVASGMSRLRQSLGGRSSDSAPTQRNGPPRRSRSSDNYQQEQRRQADVVQQERYVGNGEHDQIERERALARAYSESPHREKMLRRRRRS